MRSPTDPRGAHSAIGLESSRTKVIKKAAASWIKKNERKRERERKKERERARERERERHREREKESTSLT